jgi:hypothetical protein
MTDDIYPKLTDTGCRCPCTHIHPDDPLCDMNATGNVVYFMFETIIDMPMCRPCADVYQARMVAAGKVHA